ncbi:MAG: hypothetical protein MUP98_03320 [Candidatus Aminicenantes bacterium]|nr:hypothetical protein [Candidatus Aminicenantes bacterium]
MRLAKITAIGRPVDLSYPTNRAIVILVFGVAAAGMIFRLFSHEVWLRSGKWGLEAGFSVFLAWALCRELDPDNDLAAFIGAGLTLFGIFLWGLPSFTVLFWLLVMLRIIIRSTGLPARSTDSLAFILLGCVLVFKGNWGFGLTTALALFLDSRIPPVHKRQLYFAGLALIASAAALFIKKIFWNEGGLFWLAGGIALGISIVFIPVIRGSRVVKSLGDETGEPLRSARVAAGQGFALLIGIEAALWSGADGLRSLLPFWGAVVGAAIFQQIKPVQKI